MDSHEAAEHRFREGADESRIRNHLAEGWRSREAADAFDQIAIAVFVSRYDFADPRNDLGSPGIVQGRKAGPVAGREFHAEEAAAAVQDTLRLAERGRDVRHVPEAEEVGVGI